MHRPDISQPTMRAGRSELVRRFGDTWVPERARATTDEIDLEQVDSCGVEALARLAVLRQSWFALVNRRQDLDRGHELLPGSIAYLDVDQANLDRLHDRDRQGRRARRSSDRRRVVPLRPLSLSMQHFDIWVHDADFVPRRAILD